MNAKDCNANVVDVLAAGGLDLMALLPCPVKVPFEQAFTEFLASGAEVPADLLYCLEGHVNHHLTFYKQLDTAQDKSQLPGILITPGVNRFMGRDFRQIFTDKGIFASEKDYFNRPPHLQNELVDPRGVYFLLAVNPLVIVVDKLKLGQRPVPQSWADLLNPIYKRDLVLRAQNNTFCETVLFSFYSQFGKEGIIKLAPNVGHGCHPAEMAKNAGATNVNDWPAISLMPYFFARTIRNHDNVEIIWPQEGAIASPITMIVQKDALPRMQSVIDFLTGPAMAKLWVNAFLYPPFVDDNYPVGNGKLLWLGWDFIYNNDAHEMYESLNEMLRCEMNRNGD